MAVCNTSFLARSVSQDTFSNEITAVGLAEGLAVAASERPVASEEAPILISPFNWVFVAFLHRDDPDEPEELACRLTIVSPHGREFPGPELRVDLVTSGAARNLTMIPGFPYTGDGTYQFYFQARRDGEWVTLGKYALPMSITVQQPATGEFAVPGAG